MKKTKNKTAVFAEFSKKIIGALTVTWFAGALVGFAVVIVQVVRGDMVNISDVLMYIGAPMTGGVLAYYLKAASENKEKIRKSKGENDDRTDF